MIHRQIFDNKYYFQEKFTKSQAWIDLLLLANHTPSHMDIRGNEVLVGRGCIGRANETLAKRWQWSRGKVNRFLKCLEMDSQIEQQKTSSITLIKVIKYDSYQTDSTSDSTTERQQKDNRQYTYNNVKKKKNDNNKTATKVADSPMTLNQFYKWTTKATQRHVQIIGEYADTVKPNFKTKKQWEVFLKRNLRPARDLSHFSDEQIIDAVSDIKKAQGDGWLRKYTLETLIKFLK